MVHNIPYFVFIIFVMIVNISTYTFAPWTEKPKPPPTGTINTCYHWLYYHRFTNDNVKNKKLAQSRATEYDQDVFYFAAAYAYLLANISDFYDIRKFGPSEFCDFHSINFVNYPYITLKDAEFTCEGWIDLYLYDADRIIRGVYDPYMYRNIKIWIGNRRFSMDKKISVWASLYFEYFSLDDASAKMTPRDFCSLMGKPVMNVPLPEECPFMTLNETKMSCIEREEAKRILEENARVEDNFTQVAKLPFSNIETDCYELITQFGFSDNKAQNYIMIIEGTFDTTSVNYFAKEYIADAKYQYRSNYEGPIEDLVQLFQMLINDDIHIDIHQHTQKKRKKEKYSEPQDFKIVEKLLKNMESPEEFCKTFSFSIKDLLNHYCTV